MSKLIAVAAVVAVSSFLPAWADLRTLALSFVENTVTATDSANMLDETSEVYLVWDSADRGRDLSKWPEGNRIKYTGTVPSAKSVYEFDRTAVPAGSFMRVIATSKARRLGEGGYVYAGKSQYINTGIKANAIYGLYIKFMYSANDYDGYNAYGLLISDEGNKDFAIGRYPYGKPDGYFYFKHRNTTGTPNGYIDISGGVGQVHEIAVTNQMATLDGSVAVSGLEAGAVGQKDLRVWLNNGYLDDSTTEGSLSGKCCHARWYSVRFDDENGDAILNLVPAVWSGEGVLYDTVSGKCHANANAETGGLTWNGTPGAVIDGTEATSAASDVVENQITVALVAGEVEVGVPAGVLTSASELWLVWDSEDRGGNLADWPVENRLKYAGTVSSAAATYRFPKDGLSQSCVFRVIANDSVTLLDEGGYVYVGPDQYVNTGIAANLVYGLEITFQHTKADFSPKDKYWATLIGNNTDDDFCIGRVKYVNSGYNLVDDKFYFRKQGTRYDVSSTFVHFDLDGNYEIHTIAVSETSTSLDGNVVYDSLSSGALGKAGYNHPILIGIAPSSGKTDIASGNNGYCHAKWYSLVFKDGSGKELMNLKPAVIDGTLAVFYDSVSGKILKNAGSGSLDYGGTPDTSVNRVSAASVPVFFKRKGLIVIIR